MGTKVYAGISRFLRSVTMQSLFLIVFTMAMLLTIEVVSLWGVY